MALIYGPASFKPRDSGVFVTVAGMGELVMVGVGVGGISVALGLGATSFINPGVGLG